MAPLPKCSISMPTALLALTSIRCWQAMKRSRSEAQQTQCQSRGCRQSCSQRRKRSSPLLCPPAHNVDPLGFRRMHWKREKYEKPRPFTDLKPSGSRERPNTLENRCRTSPGSITTRSSFTRWTRRARWRKLRRITHSYSYVMSRPIRDRLRRR